MLRNNHRQRSQSLINLPGNATARRIMFRSQALLQNIAE